MFTTLTRHRRTPRTPAMAKSRDLSNRIPASRILKPEHYIVQNKQVKKECEFQEVDPVQYKGINTCVKTAYQKARVSVPVAVKPFSYAGPTTTLCSKTPVIKDIKCTGTDEQVCYFTIVQEICVEIPVHFGATASVGMAGINCFPASTEPCSED